MFDRRPGYHRLEPLGEHLHGCYFRQKDGTVLIPVLNCLRPGEGHVSRFLDALPADEVVVFAAVVSPILEGALARRGYIRDEGDDGVWRKVQAAVRRA